MRASWFLGLLLSLVACAELKRAPAPEAEDTPSPTEDDPPAVSVDSNEPTEASPKPPVQTKPVPAQPGTNGADGDGGAKPTTPDFELADRVCEAVCDWRKMCEGKNQTLCLMECGTTWNGRSTHLAVSYVSLVEPCFEKLACTGDADTCIRSYNSLERPPVFDIVQECSAARVRCKTIDDRTCSELMMFDQATQKSAFNCTGRAACEDLSSCLAKARGDLK